MKEALLYTTLNDKQVRCRLCPHQCIIADGKQGICLTRHNRGGILYATNYCRPVSIAVDPIEKKPLYHFYPGKTVFSAGPSGCTFKCSFCQNHEISQNYIEAPIMQPHEIVDKIVESGSVGIAYTYSEPYTWFETILDIAPLVHERGFVNVLVSNGYFTPEGLEMLLPHIDAMNIDIKSMDPLFYRQICKGDLAPVLAACEAVKKHCHLEITNLIIPGYNDTAAHIEKLVSFIETNLGVDTPLHFSRYFPRFSMTIPPTPVHALQQAYEIAQKTLNHVYIGNLASNEERQNTYCPRCKTLLIRRIGYTVLETDSLMPAESKCWQCSNCGALLNLKK
ncbi:MAG: AmmeMemoRadiSam system radical SAM enzyme [Chitinivibrionales bacterium]|nr:AmmeMemoRadiSam system radical SAM enzyme [Chitinivibrionales bacterium]